MTDLNTLPAPVAAPPTSSAEAPAAQDPAPEVFREVPDFDPRTLVLKQGERLLDLQFCGCVNKYKRRFSGFLKESPGFYEDVKNTAIKLAEGGYKDVDIRDILGYLKTQAKQATPAKEYLLKYSHDFELDSLPRAYIVRKLMMEESKLFGFFELNPVKCKSGCGYAHTDEPTPEPTDETDIAGF